MKFTLFKTALMVSSLLAGVSSAYASGEAPPEPVPPAATQAQSAQTVPQGNGGSLVFDSNPARSTSADTYAPDWSRFEKNGLFGIQDHSVPPNDSSVDLLAVESHYEEILGMDIPPAQRMKTLLDLADLYHKYNVKPKEAAVYEKYIETYPQDGMVPEICMRLGFIYREIGAYKSALSKFYAVLNSSMAVNRSGMDVYRQLSLRAQMEIADTNFVMGDYDQAAKFYLRLKRLDMEQGDRVKIDFKYAYTQYLIKDFTATISSFQAFIQMYPNDTLVAEAHFVLANAYKQINQPQAALTEVLSLLKYQEGKGQDSGAWLYWKKRTGNQIGNEFYEQGDYESALYIYQAMAKLSDDPAWLWPSLFQMGLCLERLHLTTKASEAYDIIIRGAEDAQTKGIALSQTLQDIADQVKWRRSHLVWADETNRSIDEIMGQ
ncbi:MAG TPA: hypothetical protein PKI32_07400 [Opitutales bacterium]|nr:hypothetical protein [Opitutales bacterium]